MASRWASIHMGSIYSSTQYTRLAASVRGQQQDGKRQMAMVDQAAKKRMGVFLQQHRRWCPRKNGKRRGLGSTANLTRTGSG